MELEDVVDENLLFLKNSVVVLEDDSKVLLVDSKLTLESDGLRTLFCTLWTTGEGHLTLCTKFGDINFCDNLSAGEFFSTIFSFLVSNGSLNVVKFSVLGGVGRGCLGSDD